MAAPAPPRPGLFTRRPVRRALHNWLDRHRHPRNFWLHMVGIPLALGGLAAMLLLPWSWWFLAALIGGYALQWAGHQLEGNDLGEWAAIKRLLGWPYVGIAPQWQKECADRPDTNGVTSV